MEEGAGHVAGWVLAVEAWGQERDMLMVGLLAAKAEAAEAAGGCSARTRSTSIAPTAVVRPFRTASNSVRSSHTSLGSCGTLPAGNLLLKVSRIDITSERARLS